MVVLDIVAVVDMGSMVALDRGGEIERVVVVVVAAAAASYSKKVEAVVVREEYAVAVALMQDTVDNNMGIHKDSMVVEVVEEHMDMDIRMGCVLVEMKGLVVKVIVERVGRNCWDY